MGRKRGAAIAAGVAAVLGTAVTLAGCHLRSEAPSAARHESGSMNRTTSIDVARTWQGVVSQMRPPTAEPESDTMRMSFGDLPQMPSPDQLTASPPTDGGIVVFEPVSAPDVAAPDADFAAGCGYYLNFAVGGQPTLGQTPLTYSLTRNKQEHFALPSLRLSRADAVAFARAVGATEAAVGTVDRLAPHASGELALTYRLLDANTARPIGEPLVVCGTPAAILAALPGVAVRLAHQAGVSHPLAMAPPAATPALLTAEVRTHRHEHPTPSDIALVTTAAPRDPIALIYVLESGQGRSAATFAANAHLLLTKLAPDNPRAWGDVAEIDSAALLPLRANLAARRKRYPNNYAFAATDAWLSHAAGDTPSMLTASEDAVRAAPNNPDAWVSLGGFLGSIAWSLRRDRVADAITPAEWNTLVALYTRREEYNRRVVTLDPCHRYAWIYLSAAAMFAGDRATAEDAYRKAVYYGPGKAVVYAWGLQLFQEKWGGNPTDLKAVAQAAASENYPKIENAGAILIDLKAAGFPAEAKALGERALLPLDIRLKTNPDDVGAHWDKASLLWHENDMPSSCREYAFVAKRLPDNLAAQVGYAAVLDKVNQYPQAAAECKAILKLDPQNAYAPVRLGNDLRHLGQTVEAERWLRIGLQRSPNAMLGHYGLGEVLLQKNLPALAAEEYHRALLLDGTDPVVYARFVVALSAAKQYSDAIHWGEEGVRLYDNGDAKPPAERWRSISILHGALGYAYLKTRQYPNAEAQNNAALALDKANVQATINQGCVYNEMGHRHKARLQWRRAATLKLTPANTEEIHHGLTTYPENGT